jgi:hypothetical protein
MNKDPDSSAAASETVAPAGKEAEQVGPQLIPDGVLVTLPRPLPDLLTMTV